MSYLSFISICLEFNSEWRCADANSSPTRLGATRLIEEFNSLIFQVGMALCRLKLISDQVRFDQAHRRVQFAKSSTGEALAGFVAQTFCDLPFGDECSQIILSRGLNYFVAEIRVGANVDLQANPDKFRRQRP